MLEPVVNRPSLLVGNRSGGGRTVLDVVDVVQLFALREQAGVGARTLSALSNVSFRVHAGEVLGLIGESGSGKTTLARTIIQLPSPTAGQVWFLGHDLARIRGRRLRRHRTGIQMVFQDPLASLNPKWRVADIVEEPLKILGAAKAEKRSRVEEVLALVGLPLSHFGQRRPRELSGGQCQRIAIARAVVSRPTLLICDEALSSLDVLVQAQMLDLFQKLRRDLSLSYLFISHDLAVVNSISDRVAVLHSGQLCEIGPTAAVFGAAGHPYTRALVASMPSLQRRVATPSLKGEPPSPLDPPSGCRFRTRCPVARALCAAKAPRLMRIGPRHFVGCHFPHV